MDRLNCEDDTGVEDFQPTNKRSRIVSQQPTEDLHKAESGVGSGETGYHQGASFGLNFVTFAEYSGLRSEHEKLQAQLQNLKKFVQENVNQHLTLEINVLKEDNRRLKEEVNQLKQDLFGKGVALKKSPDVVSVTHQERLHSVERQLTQIKSSFSKLPPAPSAETLKYLNDFVGFFSSQSTAVVQHDTNQTPEPRVTPVKKTPEETLPSPQKFITLVPLPAAITTLSPPVAEGDTAEPDVQDDSWKDVQLTPSQPAPEESPYSLKMQLLPKYNIWVNRSKLTTLLQDSMYQTENAPLFLLRKLIPMVFSWQELAFSRGQGICTKSKDENKAPLDPVKINACKDFMRLFCTQNNVVEPPDTAINTQFTHTITYARTKMKRNLGKPNCKVSTLMSDHPSQSPIKNEENMQFAEETDLELSHFESSPDTRASEKETESTLQSEYFS